MLFSFGKDVDIVPRLVGKFFPLWLIDFNELDVDINNETLQLVMLHLF